MTLTVRIQGLKRADFSNMPTNSQVFMTLEEKGGSKIAKTKLERADDPKFNGETMTVSFSKEEDAEVIISIFSKIENEETCIARTCFPLFCVPIRTQCQAEIEMISPNSVVHPILVCELIHPTMPPTYVVTGDFDYTNYLIARQKEMAEMKIPIKNLNFQKQNQMFRSTKKKQEPIQQEIQTEQKQIEENPPPTQKQNEDTFRSIFPNQNLYRSQEAYSRIILHPRTHQRAIQLGGVFSQWEPLSLENPYWW